MTLVGIFISLEIDLRGLGLNVLEKFTFTFETQFFDILGPLKIFVQFLHFNFKCFSIGCAFEGVGTLRGRGIPKASVMA